MVANDRKEKQLTMLRKYLPAGVEELIWSWITRFPLDYKIVPPRKTKLGDFRFVGKNNRPMITINGDLNKYSFLITTVHELAHFYAFEEYGKRISAHGKEWQAVYKRMMKPVLDLNLLPKDVETALVNSLVKVKASSCSDPNLFRVLKNYDRHQVGRFLDEIPNGKQFRFQDRVFKKISKRRTRIECLEVATNKKYLISGIAEVEEI